MKKFLTILFIAGALQAFSQDTIPAAKAKEYMDKLACVTGKVVSYKLASEGKRTNYINIDAPYPNAVFTIVVTNDYLENSNVKIEDLKDKIIYVYGKITTYRNDPKQTPQIYNPRWIDVKK